MRAATAANAKRLSSYPTGDEYARRIAYVIDEEGRIAQAHGKVDARTYPQEQLKAL